MRNPAWWGLGMVAVLCMGPARGDDRQADRDIITRGERELSQAYVTGDDRRAAALLSDDYRGIGSNGGISDKKATLEDIRSEPHESSADPFEIDVQFFGDAAIARVREKEIGPAPELSPAWRVITDSWIKRGGTWRLVAAEELDAGPPALAAQSSAISDIKSARDLNNRAIAAHDLNGFLPLFADDAGFVVSNGASVSKPQLTELFAKDFADPAFVTYVRAPGRVSISDTGLRAVEHGTWTALKREPRGETRYGGDYMAQWSHGLEGWRVRGEIYVKLHCAGPLCTP